MTTHGTGSRSLSRPDSKNLQMSKEVTNESRKTEGYCHSLDNGVDGVKTVAIVGAGFAGLVLANYLELHLKYCREKQQNENGTVVVPKNRLWAYTLFESKSRSGIPVIGTICLESARKVLEELSLFDEACGEESGAGPVFPQIAAHDKNSQSATTKNDDRYQEVSREAFLELLRKNAKIQSSSRVVDIVVAEASNDESLEKTNRPIYFVVIEGEDRKRAKHGPFDLVVAANGLSFRGETTKALQKTLKVTSSIAKIGDSRYRYGRHWWDFDFLGFTRRTSGADTAIRDGLQVGQRLLQDNLVQENEGIKKSYLLKFLEGGSNVTMSSTGITPISSQQNLRMSYQENFVKLVQIVVVILLPIMLAIKLYY
mmetsp:Transcript_3490/g.8311  ORF Transcript_3490/g.8311 Transcript_3490/m.8311 type:complete len:369 (+) Transcript_3490:51-1157(+)